jgi:hypothetical protein
MSQLPIDLDAEAIQFDGHWYTREDLARRIKQMLDSGDFAVGKISTALEQLTTVMASLRTLAFRLPPEMADQLSQVSVRHGRTLGSLIRESLTVHLNLKGVSLLEGSAAASATALPLPSAPPALAAPPAPPAPLVLPAIPDRPPLLGRKATEPEMPVVTRGVVGTGVGSHPTPPGGIPMSALPPELRVGPPPIPTPLLQSAVIAGPGAIKAAQPERVTIPPAPPSIPSVPSVLVDKSAIVTEDASPDEAAAAVSLGGPKKKQDEDPLERGWFGR